MIQMLRRVLSLILLAWALGFAWFAALLPGLPGPNGPTRRWC